MCTSKQEQRITIIMPLCHGILWTYNILFMQRVHQLAEYLGKSDFSVAQEILAAGLYSI